MFPFRTALNASTLFPFTRDPERHIAIAGEAGYEGVELWVGDIQLYLSRGGSTERLRAAAEEAGVELVNAIAFFPWADADADVRLRGLRQAEEEMRLLAQLGCKAVAAPPFGDVATMTAERFADAYAALCELGQRLGVEPLLEFWGRAKRLATLREAVDVLNVLETRGGESGFGRKLLLDPFHMYTGGSPFESLGELDGPRIGLFHVNDYPASPPRESIGDDARVFPGEGVAPTSRIAELLYASGYRGYLSLELFRDSYGDRNAAEVAADGLRDVKRAYAIRQPEQ
ncbi:sugar phosphate isomerase/epimerase family protein [Paenibacillus sp.]|uniref:sugar phosphate isomerase/epimerase family protein n=1 Tax=Paenibacillus sp. TaxID=58172 RepID=UPI002D6C11B7|nr:sugar phosphate isomerase/epimerase family protein [Paenibacillus sp.]HZG55987.1 sugar phosphate isomerase/epimerase family protein [Paenibacillus sp.]